MSNNITSLPDELSDSLPTSDMPALENILDKLKQFEETRESIDIPQINDKDPRLSRLIQSCNETIQLLEEIPFLMNTNYDPTIKLSSRVTGQSSRTRGEHHSDVYQSVITSENYRIDLFSREADLDEYQIALSRRDVEVLAAAGIVDEDEVDSMGDSGSVHTTIHNRRSEVAMLLFNGRVERVTSKLATWYPDGISVTRKDLSAAKDYAIAVTEVIQEIDLIEVSRELKESEKTIPVVRSERESEIREGTKYLLEVNKILLELTEPYKCKLNYEGHSRYPKKLLETKIGEYLSELNGLRYIIEMQSGDIDKLTSHYKHQCLWSKSDLEQTVQAVTKIVEEYDQKRKQGYVFNIEHSVKDIRGDSKHVSFKVITPSGSFQEPDHTEKTSLKDADRLVFDYIEPGSICADIDVDFISLYPFMRLKLAAPSRKITGKQMEALLAHIEGEINVVAGASSLLSMLTEKLENITDQLEDTPDGELEVYIKDRDTKKEISF